jgi:integrase
MAAAGITPSNIESSRFNQWLSSLTTSRTTKCNYRRMAKTLWSYASRKKLSRIVGNDLIIVKQKFHPPVCWTADELRKLMSVANEQTGRFRASGCPCNLFWKTWVLVGFETGLRMSDLHHLHSSQLKGSRLYVTHHKTGQPQGKLLSPNAVALVRLLLTLSTDGSLFRWALSRKHIFLQFKKLVKSAGLQGSTKYLRRSCATYCEIKKRGSAKVALGHLSDGLAYKSYVDPTLLEDEIPTPLSFLSQEGVGHI